MENTSFDPPFFAIALIVPFVAMLLIKGTATSNGPNGNAAILAIIGWVVGSFCFGLAATDESQSKGARVFQFYGAFFYSAFLAVAFLVEFWLLTPWKW